jgi:hypothetical protein
MRVAPAVVWLCLAIASATLLSGRMASAAPFEVAGRDWEGCADFVQLARERLGTILVVANGIDFRDLRAEDSLILIHPEVRLDDLSLSGFMAAGGRVILLDDYGTGDTLLRRYSIRRRPTPLRPVRALRHNAEFAIAEPTGEHALVRDVTHVVTNHATTLQPSLTPLLQIPNLDGEAAVVALAGFVSNEPNEDGGAVDQVSTDKFGRLVVVGDPSIVMNSMLRYPGNKQFAENVIAFAARNDDPGKRGRVYLATGAFNQTGTFPGSSELTHVARHAGDVLEDALHEGLGPRAAYALAALVGLGIVVWVGSRAARTYHAATPSFTRPLPLAAQGGAAGHAAVTGGRSAPRALAMYELEKALEEDLALLLGLDRVPAHDVLLARMDAARILDRETLGSLRKLLLRMATIETLLIARRTEALKRIRNAEVLATARTVHDILRKAHVGARERLAA